MKNIIFILLISFIYSDEFIIQNQSIQFEINNQIINQPFLGGFNQPRIQWLDWNLDGKIDLFVKDEDKYLRYYENKGTSNDADLQLVSTNFQNLELGSWFEFHDFDTDGDYDLVTQNESIISGSYRGVSYYINQGAILSLFSDTLFTNNLDPIYSEAVSTPTFIDIDADGDLDFFSGNSGNGSVSFYQNIGLFNNSPVFSYVTNFWQNISIIGSLANQRHGASAITFIDLDSDGDYDLSWGDYFQQSLYIVWNIGNNLSPEMDINNIITEYPENNPIITAGQNMPTFADLDGDNDFDLFVTVLFGAFGTQYVDNFIYYENNGSNNIPTYDFVSDNYFNTLDFYTDSSPEAADIDNDGDLDLFIGTEIDFSTFPYRGRIKFFKNIGDDSNPSFELIDPYFLGTNIGINLTPCIKDIDNDTDLDFFIGEWNGKIKYYKNLGTPNNFSFEYIGDIEAYNSDGIFSVIDLPGRSSPDLIDIDDDGDLDLFIGNLSGNIVFYENFGNLESFEFHWITDNFELIDVNEYASPMFINLDSDNDYDLLVGSGSDGIIVYENIGNNENPDYLVNSSINCDIKGKQLSPAAFSFFNPYTIDMLVGLGTGGLYHTRLNICHHADVNFDNNVDVLDIIEIISFILFENTYQPEILCSGDFNEDNSIDIFDLVSIVNMILEV